MIIAILTRKKKEFPLAATPDRNATKFQTLIVKVLLLLISGYIFSKWLKKSVVTSREVVHTLNIIS